MGWPFIGEVHGIRCVSCEAASILETKSGPCWACMLCFVEYDGLLSIGSSRSRPNRFSNLAMGCVFGPHLGFIFASCGSRVLPLRVVDF